jgi:hypothetical protein
MTGQIEAGAMVECADYPLGAVERVDTADGDGALFVRPARADYLLKIPVSLIAETHAPAGSYARERALPCQRAPGNDMRKYAVKCSLWTWR